MHALCAKSTVQLNHTVDCRKFLSATACHRADPVSSFGLASIFTVVVPSLVMPSCWAAALERSMTRFFM